MGLQDSALDQAEMARARALLNPAARPDPTWPALVAATLLAVTAVAFATVMVVAPPVSTQHVAQGAPD